MHARLGDWRDVALSMSRSGLGSTGVQRTWVPMPEYDWSKRMVASAVTALLPLRQKETSLSATTLLCTRHGKENTAEQDRRTCSLKF